MSTRRSPIRMGMDPQEVVRRDGWEVALTYLGEKIYGEPFVADLSHVPKWAFRGRDPEGMKPVGLSVPDKPGEVAVGAGMVVARLSAGECRLLVVGDETPSFEDPPFTDLTDAYAVLALVGLQCLDILSRLSAVDLNAPRQRVPCAAQAPLEDVPCLIVRLVGQGGTPGLIISVDRGYGQFILEAVLDAGSQYGLGAAGWKRFSAWFLS